MKDARGRTITYLRLSLTDRCNFRCVYCMPPEGVKKIPHAGMLRFEELIALVRLMSERLEITKVKVTGGEPLVRRGVIGFMRDLCALPALHDVGLTTNGFFLEDMAADLRDAGVGRLNVSLDTMRPDRFREITRRDGLSKVLRGIDAARRCGFSPVKLNVVVMKETLDEVPDFLAFGIDTGIEIRFIERMPFTAERIGAFVSNRVVKGIVEQRRSLRAIDAGSASTAPAARYYLGGTEATCGFISPVSDPFCARCDRLRLKGDGKLIACLKGGTRYNLLPLIRPRFRADALAARIENVIGRDSKERSPGERPIIMSQIGG